MFQFSSVSVYCFAIAKCTTANYYYLNTNGEEAQGKPGSPRDYSHCLFSHLRDITNTKFNTKESQLAQFSNRCRVIITH